MVFPTLLSRINLSTACLSISTLECCTRAPCRPCGIDTCRRFRSITDSSFLQRGGASCSSTIRMPNYISRSLFKAWFPALHCAAYWPRRPRTDLAVNWRISVTYSFVYHFGGTAGPTAAWIGNHTPCPLLVTKGSTLQSAALRPSRPRADPTVHWRTSTPPPRLALSYKI